MTKLRIPVSTLPAGVPGFVRWLRVAHPKIHQRLAARIAGGTSVAGLGIVMPSGVALTAPQATATVNAAASNPGTAQQILTAVKDLVAVGLPLYQQQKLFDLQVKRAQQNLAPLDTAAIADASGMRFGLDTSTQNTGLMIGGLFVAGLLGYALLRRS